VSVYAPSIVKESDERLVVGESFLNPILDFPLVLKIHMYVIWVVCPRSCIQLVLAPLQQDWDTLNYHRDSEQLSMTQSSYL
jgi:hypothetical protein